MNTTLSEKESLQIIQEMVQSTRGNLSKSANLYLLWGWLVVISAIVHFALLKFTAFEQPYLVWPILMPLGGIISIFLVKNMARNEQSLSYVDRMMGITYTALLGPLVLCIIIGAYYDWAIAYPIFMSFYGFASIIAGGILRFKAFFIGGLVSLTLGIASVFVNFEIQLLFIALAITSAYLVPGYMLKNLNK